MVCKGTLIVFKVAFGIAPVDVSTGEIRIESEGFVEVRDGLLVVAQVGFGSAP